MHRIRITVTLILLTAQAVIAQRFHCVAPYDCVDRPSFHIQAIVHGTYNETFWQQIQAAMFQAGSDMNVTFGMKLYDTFDSYQMASDISVVGSALPKPDALIVSVPDGIVQNAVGNLIQDYQLPVFGVNVGANVASAMGILGFVSIDDYLGGKAAGEFFASADHNHTTGLKGLFVNPDCKFRNDGMGIYAQIWLSHALVAVPGTPQTVMCTWKNATSG